MSGVPDVSGEPGPADTGGEPALPDGFLLGHWTDPDALTGCTVVLAPPGTRGSVDVRGGGTGTRELENLSPLANAEGPSAVLLTGGSAFGLAAADGVVRWLEERGIGRPTPGGVVPLVPTAVVFDLVAGSSARRPGPAEGYAACEAAVADGWARGPVGAGAGTAVGKLFGRDRAMPGGVGHAAARAGRRNDCGRGRGGQRVRRRDRRGRRAAGRPTRRGRRDRPHVGPAPTMPQLPEFRDIASGETGNTTLACVCTDASIDKRSCAIVARMASAGIARAVDPTFTPIDGDVVFCLASGTEPPAPPGLAASWSLTVLGTVAATLTAAAIRDAIPRV